MGNPAQGQYAGLPGKAYAKILQEMWTEISPTGAYWNQTRVLSDNRLAAFNRDASSYAFGAPERGEVSVEVSLLFRRVFIELANQKGWDVRDIVMEQEHILLNP